MGSDARYDEYDYEDDRRGRDSRRPRPARRRRAPERVEWEGHPVWQGMIGWYVKWFCVATFVSVCLWLASRADMIKIYWLVLAMLVMFPGVLWLGRLIRHSTTYRITNRSISETSGILSTSGEHARLDEITNTRVDRSMLERLLGIGRINFDTAGERFTTKDILNWYGVRNPYALQALVERLRDGDDDDYEPFDGERDDPMLNDERTGF